jgi:hypothetical protein
LNGDIAVRASGGLGAKGWGAKGWGAKGWGAKGWGAKGWGADYKGRRDDQPPIVNARHANLPSVSGD